MTPQKQETLANPSFCLFRLPEKGGRALWEITNSCNYSCGYCIFSAQKKSIKGELSTKEVIKGLNELEEKDFSYIKFTGGEPFIRKDFLEILKNATGLGFVIDVSTNGSLITKGIARELNKLNLNMIHVSVDGPTEYVHELARGNGSYQPTITGLKNLSEQDLYVRVGTVIFRENESRLEEMIQSAESLGADEIIFSFMEPVGRMRGNRDIISIQPISQIKDELKRLATAYDGKIKVNYSFTEDSEIFEEGACPAVKRFVYIDNLGRVSPCTWVVERYPQYRSEKTLHDSSFEEILGSKPIQSYLAYVDKLRQEKIDGCPVRSR